jgi:hypothetical protein
MTDLLLTALQTAMTDFGANQESFNHQLDAVQDGQMAALPNPFVSVTVTMTESASAATTMQFL